MREKGVLQLALQLDFLVTMVICNSMYFYTLSCIRQVVQLQWTHCTCIWNHILLEICTTPCN